MIHFIRSDYLVGCNGVYQVYQNIDTPLQFCETFNKLWGIFIINVAAIIFILWLKSIEFWIRKHELFGFVVLQRVVKWININICLQKKVNFFGGDFFIDFKDIFNVIVKDYFVYQ